MNGLLDARSIKQKLRAAFGIVLLVLLAVALAGLRGASRTEHNARGVVERIQPVVLAVMELENQVHRSAASMGFYLKSGSPAHAAPTSTRCTRFSMCTAVNRRTRTCTWCAPRSGHW